MPPFPWYDFSRVHPAVLGPKWAQLCVAYGAALFEMWGRLTDPRSYQPVVRDGARPRSQTSVAPQPASAAPNSPATGGPLPEGVVSLDAERSKRRTA